jgi:hypothetical protein
MTSDILTKALTRELVDRFQRKMCIVGEWSKEKSSDVVRHFIK